MTIYEMIKHHGQGKGEAMMWKTVSLISDWVEKRCDDVCELKKQMYAMMMGNHYNDEFARERVAHMSYTGTDGVKHQAPYWKDDELESRYNDVRAIIPAEYNYWDFMVAMNGVRTDYGSLIESWFGDGSETRFTEMVVKKLSNTNRGDGIVWLEYE